MRQSTLPHALCDFFLSPPSLSLPGHRPKVWAFQRLSLVLLLTLTAPWCPQLCLSWPSLLASAKLFPETPSLSMCPCFRSGAGDSLLWGCAKDLLYFWPVLLPLLSLKHISVPAPHLKWCNELHILIMLKVLSHGPPSPQVSLLHACLASGTLPCYLPSHHTWFPSSSQPLSFLPPSLLSLQISGGAAAPPQCCPACPTTPSAQEALCCPPTGTTLHPSTPDSVSLLFSLCTNFELSLTVLCHDSLVAYIKLNPDAARTSLICGLFSSEEHWVFALVGEIIWMLVCRIGMKWMNYRTLFQVWRLSDMPSVAGLCADLLWLTV